MAVFDYLGAPVFVNSGGRCFRCEKPTVLTVWTLVCTYSNEIKLLRGTETTHEQLMRVFLGDRSRAARVLSSCVSGIWDEATVNDADLLHKMTQAVLGTCDPMRILDGLNLDAEPDQSEEPEGVEDERVYPPPVDGLDWTVSQLARRFNCTPYEVMQWPYEVFLVSLQVINAEEDAEKPKEAGSMPGIRRVH